MKIPSALEEMVAGLISDEKQKREEVEAVLSAIHEMTEAYFDPDRGESEFPFGVFKQAPPPEPEAPTPVLSDAEKVENFTKAFERRGMPPERARDAAEEACGLRDGSR